MSDVVLNGCDSYEKVIICPPDKSISIRAVILGACASGVSRIKNLSSCDDVLSAVDCVKRLGADVKTDGDTTIVSGAPFYSAKIDCGNSATTARLLTGLLSGVDGVFAVDGDRSLRSRDMSALLNALRDMGASIVDTAGKLPFTVTGRRLRGGVFNDISSAQVKSALLLAGLNASSPVIVNQSFITRDHTEIMLAAMGCDVRICNKTVTLSPSTLGPRDLTVPGDISSAAYPIGLALCVPFGRCTVKNVGLNSTRTAVLDILRCAGANITVTETGMNIGDITVDYAKLGPIAVDGTLAAQAIDEIPLLAAVAVHIDGVSRISGVGALCNKETDRIKTTAAALNSLGADVMCTEDGLIINGGKPLSRGVVDPMGDHRIAMAAAVAASAGGGAVIKNADCVSVSYPRFFGEVIGV